MILTSHQAFMEAQKQINAACVERGIDPLRNHDIALIAAYTPFERAYNNVLARLQDGQDEQFNADCVTYAKKCIATAILA